MPCDTYAFEADILDSRKLNMVTKKQSQERLGTFHATCTLVVHSRQRRTSPGKKFSARAARCMSFKK